MNSKDLTYQAFQLYKKIKTNVYNASVPSSDWNRLYSLEERAFCRYIRRLKLEVKELPLVF